MSFTDRLVLWLHVGFAIFAVGPVTVAIMTTPRYIRKRDLVVIRFLRRTTLLYTIISLGVLIAGLVLADLLHDFSKPWLTVSMTLFIVALVLLALIIRDQHRAIVALEDAEAEAAEAAEADQASRTGQAGTASTASLPAGSGDADGESHIAHVERGRIASLGGVVALIWLVILVLMVWR
jgi:hypothetical protein